MVLFEFPNRFKVRPEYGFFYLRPFVPPSCFLLFSAGVIVVVRVVGE